jgi:hypothetical protein
VLLANNTLFGPGPALRVWDNLPLEEYGAGQVEFCNNLLVGPLYHDMSFMVSKDTRVGISSTAKAREVARLWRFHHNAREFAGAAADQGFPLGQKEWRLGAKDLLSRQPGSADFLRPAPRSRLATGGAGKGDPSLPIYVGAFPPPGTAAWDWARTWKARLGKKGG